MKVLIGAVLVKYSRTSRYKRYEAQVEKTKSSNREEEGQYEKNEMNHIEPGSEWERVAKHCDFSAKVDVGTNYSLLLVGAFSPSIVYLLDIYS